MHLNKRNFLSGTFLTFGLSGYALSRMSEPNFDGFTDTTDTISLASNCHITNDGWRMRSWQVTNTGADIVLDRTWGAEPARVTVKVKGPGWDIQGNFVPDAERAIPGIGFMREMWKKDVSQHNHPGSAQIETDQGPRGIWSDVSIVRQIYRGESCSAALEQGWSWSGARRQEISISNQSGLSYEKAMIDWLEPLRSHKNTDFSVILTGGSHIEARHGRPLACVKVIAVPWNIQTGSRDFDENEIVKTAEYCWSGETDSPGLGSPVWKADFQISEMRPGLYHFYFEDLPWVGDSTSKRANSITEGLDPRYNSLILEGDQSVGRQIQPLAWWIGSYPTERHSYVAAADNINGLSGSDTTGQVGLTIEAARTMPFATFDAAWLALFDPRYGGHPDASACHLWLSDGTHTFRSSGPSKLVDSHASISPVKIMSDNTIGANKNNCKLVSTGSAYTLFQGSDSIRSSFLSIEDITLFRDRSSFGFIKAKSLTCSTLIHISNCDIIDLSSQRRNFFSNGIVTSYSNSSIKNSEISSFCSPSNYTLFVHNCETFDSIRCNVAWGVKYTNPLINNALFFGSGISPFLREDNLIAGYLYCSNWSNTRTAFFINYDIPKETISDCSISVCLVRSIKNGLSTRFLRIGEDIDKNYKNLIIEGVSTRRPYMSSGGKESTNGFNIHNDPLSVPVSEPGIGYKSVTVRLCDLAMLAMKGDVFHARNNNGSPMPETAHFLTGARDMRNGSNFYGNIIGVINPSFAPNIIGYLNLTGTPSNEYIPYYKNADALDYSMKGGYMNISSEFVTYGYDLMGRKMHLNGTDSGGAFVSSPEAPSIF